MRIVEVWNFLYDPIEGFAHEEGSTYKLRVARRRIANSPADGSAYSYRLLQLVKKNAAQAGT